MMSLIDSCEAPQICSAEETYLEIVLEACCCATNNGSWERRQCLKFACLIANVSAFSLF
jgi:hypothetical protein